MENKAPLCLCGCGQPVKPGRKFITHHNLKFIDRSVVETIPQTFCLCGCGELTMPGNTHILGHSIKGKHIKRSKESIEKQKKTFQKTKVNGWIDPKKGKTYEEIFGPEKAKIKKEKFIKTFTETWKKRKKNGYVSPNKGKKLNHLSSCKCCVCEAKKGRAYNKGLKDRKLEDIIGKTRAKEAREKIGKGVSKWHKNPKNKKKKEQWLINTTMAHDISPNKPEKRIIKLLNQWYPNEFIFTGNGLSLYPISYKFPDFVNIYYPIIVEHFGIHWHKEEEEYQRTNRFRNKGYETIIIWENELYSKNGEEILKNKIDNIRDKIRR